MGIIERMMLFYPTLPSVRKKEYENKLYKKYFSNKAIQGRQNEVCKNCFSAVY
jgi:hypothetical protein